MTLRRQTGLSLVEMIAVILVMSGGFLGLARLMGNTSAVMKNAEERQLTTQYAQNCAEAILNIKRSSATGFTTLKNNLATICDASRPWGVLPAGYNASVTTRLVAATSTTNVCPSGVECVEVTATVSRGTTSSSVTLHLVNY